MVEPGSQARTVVLESSLDGKAWTPTNLTTKTNADGEFDFVLNTSSAGTKHYRVRVLKTQRLAETVGGDELVAVFDYKAAGRRYLDCVKTVNAKSKEFEKLVGLAAIKQSARKMVKRKNRQASACATMSGRHRSPRTSKPSLRTPTSTQICGIASRKHQRLTKPTTSRTSSRTTRRHPRG